MGKENERNEEEMEKKGVEYTANQMQVSIRESNLTTIDVDEPESQLLNDAPSPRPVDL